MIHLLLSRDALKQHLSATTRRILTGLALATLLAGFATGAQAADEAYTDLSDTNPGTNVPTGALDSVTDNISAGSTIGNDFIVIDNGGSANLTIDGTSSLSAGVNALTIQAGIGDEQYTGATIVQNHAVLILNGDGSTISASSGVSIDGTSKLQIDEDEAISDLSGAGSVATGGNKLTVSQDTSTTFSGIISGASGQLEVAGTGSNTLTLSGVNTYTGATTIDSGGGLAISGSGSIADSSGVADSGTFDISGASGGVSIKTLTGGGNVDLGANTLTLTQANDTFSGVISSTTSAGGLTINDSTETLTGANTYTGATTIQSGAELRIGSGGSIVDTSSVNLTGSSTLELDTNATVNNLNVDGNSLVNVGTNTMTLANTTTGTVANGLIGSGSIIKTGTGTEILSANNSAYSGAYTINGGILQVTGSIATGSSVTIGASGTLDIAGVSQSVKDLNGSGSVTLSTNSTGGTLTDNIVSNQSWTGVISNGGTSAGNVIFAGTSTANVLSIGAAQTYTGTTNIQTNAAVTATVGGVFADSSAVTVNGQFNFGSTAQTLNNLTGAGAINSTSGTLTVDDNTSTSFSGAFDSTSGGLTVDGGTLTLSGSNDYSGATTIASGATLVITDETNIAGSSGISLGGGTLQVGNTTTNPITQGITLTSGSTINETTGDTGVLSGTITGAHNLTVNNGQTGSLTFSGNNTFGSTGGGNLTVDGGTLTLSGSNTYDGATTIASGATLALSGAGSIADTTGVADAGTFDISGVTSGVSVATLTGAGGVNLGTKTLTLTAGSGTYSGVIAASAGSVVVDGTGTEIFSGVNLYTGSTTIGSGEKLQLQGSGSIADSSNVVDNGIFNINSTSTINDLSGSGAVQLGSHVLTVNETSSSSFSGSIGGSGGLTVTGSAIGDVLTLSGTTTYTGATAVNSGTLKIDGSNTIADSSGVSVASGAKLDLASTSQTVNNLTGSGSVTLGTGTLTIDNVGTSYTFGGAISGTGNLVVDGTNQTSGNGLTLSGTNTYSGTTTLQNGAIVWLDGGGSTISDSSSVILTSGSLALGDDETINNLTGSGSLDVSGHTATIHEASGGTSYSGNINNNGGGASNVIVTGGSTSDILELTAGNAYSGTTEVSSGTLKIDYSGGTTIAASSGVTVDSGAVLDLNSTNQTINNLAGAGSVTLGTGTLTMDVVGQGSAFNGVISDAGSSTPGSLVIDGTNQTNGYGFTLGGANTYYGTTTLQNGAQVFLSTANAIANSSAVSIGSGSNLAIEANQSINNLSGAGTIANFGDTLTVTTSGATTFSGYMYDAGGGHGALTVLGATTTSVLTLSGTNTYTGATTVSSGVLQITGTDAIADSASVTVASGAVLDLDNTTQTINNLSGVSGSSVTIGTGALTVDQSQSAETFAGTLSGSGSFTYVGASGSDTLTLSGDNSSFTGNTNVNGGTLSIGAADNVGTGAIAMADGTTLTQTSALVLTNTITITGTGTFNTGGLGETLSGNITDGGSAGTLVAAGSGGTLQLLGTNTYTGGTTVDSGVTLNVDNSTNLGSGAVTLDAGTLEIAGSGGGSDTITNAVTLSGGGTINVDSGEVATFSALVSGAGGLTVNNGDTGTLVISGGANTFTGGITVDGGTLSFTSGGTSGSTDLGANALTLATGVTLIANGTGQTISNAITLAGTDTITLTGSNSDTFSGAIGGTGANLTTNSGTGTVTLQGNNTFTGTLTVNTGNLFFDGDTNAYTHLVVDSGAVATGFVSSMISGDIALNNGTVNFTTSSGGNFSNIITLTTSGTIASANGDTNTVSGLVTGTGDLHIGNFGNAGTIALTHANSYVGNTYIDYGALQVTNENQIGNGGSGIVYMANGTTLSLDAALTVTNTIAATGTDTINTNGFSAGLSGTITGSGALSETGTGNLTLSGSNSFSGGVTVDNGTLTVASGGASGSNLGTGAVTIDGGATLALSGTTTSGTAISNAISLATTGSNSTINSATNNVLSGAITGPGGLAKTGAGTLTLSNAGNTYAGGTSIGAGALSVGAADNLGTGTVSLATGTTLDFTGSDSFHQNFSLTGATTFNIASGDVVVVTGVISGAGATSFTETGAGQLIFTQSNTYLGSTEITSGNTLVVNGDDSSVTGTTTIDSGALLTTTGTGTLGGSVVLAGGTIRAGDAPGTLIINGNLSASSTSSFVTELTGGCTSGSTCTPAGEYAAPVATAGTFSLVQVTTTATLTNMVLNLDPIGATSTPSTASKYYRGTAYTFLTAGSVTGTYNGTVNGTVLDATTTSTASGAATAASITSTAAGDSELAYSLSYTATSVTATIVRAELFANAPGLTGNEQAVASSLDAVQETTTTGNLNTLMNALSAVSTSQQAALLNGLSGEVNADIQHGTVASMSNFNGMLAKRLGGDCNTDDFLSTNPTNTSQHAQLGSSGSASASAAWACGYGSFDQTDATGGANSLDTTLAGTAFGFEYKPTGATLVRFGAGYGHSDMSLGVTGDSVTVNSLQAGGYGQYNFFNNNALNAYVGGTLSGGYNFGDSRRNTILGTATASPDGYDLSASALVGFATKYQGVTIQPVASAEYIYNNQDSYAESGAPGANLSVDSSSTSTVRTSIGTQVEQTFNVGSNLLLTPQVHVAAIYDLGDVTPSVDESFAGGGPGFTVNGTNPGRLGAQGGAGASLDFGQGLAGFVDYNGTFKDHETDNLVLGGVKYRF